MNVEIYRAGKSQIVQADKAEFKIYPFGVTLQIGQNRYVLIPGSSVWIGDDGVEIPVQVPPTPLKAKYKQAKLDLK